MNSSSPPPIDPNLLDARIKPLVPPKAKVTPSSGNGTKTTTTPVSHKKSQTKNPNETKRAFPKIDFQHPKTERSPSPPSEKSGKPESEQAMSKPSGGNLTPQIHDTNDLNSADSTETKGSLSWLWVAVVCFLVEGPICFFFGKDVAQREYEPIIVQLTNEVQQVSSNLAATIEMHDLRTAEWNEERAALLSRVEELQSDCSLAEAKIRDTEQTSQDRIRLLERRNEELMVKLAKRIEEGKVSTASVARESEVDDRQSELSREKERRDEEKRRAAEQKEMERKAKRGQEINRKVNSKWKSFEKEADKEYIRIYTSYGQQAAQRWWKNDRADFIARKATEYRRKLEEDDEKSFWEWISPF